MNVVYLNRNELKKAGAIVDIREFYEKYSLDKRNNSYSMLQNAPIIMNVDGTYVSLTKLATLDIKGKYVIEQYLREIRSPIESKVPFLCLKWK